MVVKLNRIVFMRHALCRIPWYIAAEMKVIRATLLTLLCLAFAAPARAHPHVWVTIHSELVYGANGKITGVSYAWTFDEMYSAFALQGQEGKDKNQYTREELAPLAKENVESLKELDYFTFVTADGVKAPLSDPLPDYWFDYKDSVLTLHFTLPFQTPVKAKLLKIDIYDPTIFVDLVFAKQTPVRLVGAPTGCKLDVAFPREMTYAEGKKFSEIPQDQPSMLMAWGAQFANKIFVNCP